MTYAWRRRIGNAVAGLTAAAITAGSALALGGHAPDPVAHAMAARPPERPATRDAVVHRTVRVGGPARPATVAAVHPGAAPAAALPAPAGGSPATGPRTPPARAPHPRRTTSRHGAGHTAPPAGAPAPGTQQPVSEGGYRAFASATAAIVSAASSGGDLVAARAGSGAALDGHPLDTADELGDLVTGLPDGRTAFGRAIALRVGSAGDQGATTSSSPPAGPAASGAMGDGSGARATARTDASGSCVLGGPISSAEASAGHTADGAVALTDSAHTLTESRLEADGTHWALVTRAHVLPPAVSIAAGTPGAVAVRFLGPVVLVARAGGTAGSAGVDLGPGGTDAAAPLVEVTVAGRMTRYTAADVLDGGGRTLHLGAVTLTLGGAPRAWRGDAGTPPVVRADGTGASAAADVLAVRLANGAHVELGHVEASAAVPAGGVACGR